MSSNFSKAVLNLPRGYKRSIALAVDALLCVATVAVAFALRLDGWVYPQGNAWFAYGSAVVLALPLFISFGLYRAIFRYAGWGAFVTVAKACVVYGLAFSFVITALGISGVPRTVGLIQPLLLFLAIGLSRALARYLLGGDYRTILRIDQRQRVMVYGAGSAGRQLAAAIQNSHDMHLAGYLDDNHLLANHYINGKRIYPTTNVANTVSKLEIDSILLAVPSASRPRRAEIVQSLAGTGASIRTLPSLMDIAHGKVTVQDLREVGIEDLLGREPIPPAKALLHRNTRGKTVLVTGAGGSIGGELCRQIYQLAPQTLILVDSSEFNLYSIEQELQQANSKFPISETPPNVIPLLASVCDDQRICRILEEWRPDTVYHAAAYKHVPIVEMNPEQGVYNNVFGTLTLAKHAVDAGVADFVLISTDKAVRPTNIMGTSKRLAELVLQAMATLTHTTCFSIVRFGNVLGSSGSVVPLFRRQISVGGPVTLTDPEITRYFMTIPEAAQLVIQAGAMAQGGEVFVLDMGEPIKIIELARRMIELSGLTVKDEQNLDGDVEIQYIGLRPGEKLYEELLIGNNPASTGHPRIMKAREYHIAWDELTGLLEQLKTQITSGDAEGVVATLRNAVPEAETISAKSKPTRAA